MLLILFINKILKMSEESFLCIKCGKIPEILNIHTDNCKIEFKCKNCGIYEVLIDDYFDSLSKNKYFKKCYYCEKDNKEKYYYCFACKNDFCDECIKKEKHSDHEYIEVNEKKKICLKHNKEFKYFCFDDQENLCEIDKIEHKNHKIEEISNYNNILADINIDEINTQLENIIEINKLILNNEDYFIESIKNIGKSLEEGNKRDSKDMKYLLNGLSKDIENSKKAIKSLIDDYKIQLKRKDKYLHLYNRELKDKGLEIISQIKFNQLKDINLSKNKIKDIKPFNKMSLPFLEFLNLSDNEIKIIEPVTKLKSLNLEYIFLQKNQIEDIQTFSESHFPALKILRAEGNNLDGENDQDEEEKRKKKDKVNEVNGKYPGKFIYKSLKQQIIDFNKKYKLAVYKMDSKNENEIAVPEEKSEEYLLKSETDNYNKIDLEKINENNSNNDNQNNEESVEKIVENIVSIELNDLDTSDSKMLKNLLLIISYNSENKIKQLILRNTKITDASLLTKITFNSLIKLDLAVNKIKESKFLADIKAPKLEELYLDNNCFKDFYPILNVDPNSVNDKEILKEMEEEEFKEYCNNTKKELQNNVKPLFTSKYQNLKVFSLNDNDIPSDNTMSSNGNPQKYAKKNSTVVQEVYDGN